MMNGDHPFSTASAECRGIAALDTARASGRRRRRSIGAADAGGVPPSIGITTGGFQTLRNATITSSEKTAATMSTSPGSWKLDQ